MKMRTLAAAASVASLALVLTACSPDAEADTTTTDGQDQINTAEGGADISGEITVLTQRTDLVDNVFQDYKAEFESLYPDVTVTFEAITDYEGEVTTRMSTTDYGDVLLIPNTVSPSDLPDFFEPLGTVEELAQTYRFIESEQNYDGLSYGVAITGNANGLVYNKAVWEAAGVTDLPTSPDEFLDALQAVADNTDAIPLYTNYGDGWPLTQWESNRGGVSANPDAVIELAHMQSPWAPGEDHFIIDSLIYDAVERGL